MAVADPLVVADGCSICSLVIDYCFDFVICNHLVQFYDLSYFHCSVDCLLVDNYSFDFIEFVDSVLLLLVSSLRLVW